MYTIDLILRHVPMPVGVERKDTTAAEALYQTVCQAMASGTPTVLELTCDRQVGKKLTVLTTDIVAVQLADKNASTAVSSRGGFFAQLVQPPST
ncbi:hypothetical protein L5470_12335 [Synechococcus sp. PCC 6717]|jgi:hypothetical protein|uniref:UPF0367 protein BRW62_09840 n=1 Tax=Parathermosynechococcus lividus PCC 6715 TaxID=1917166 RepID=A0A2D2Q3A9_PARLV|nr:hypothetical protein [Thermostichus lividus]ATS18993.1 hypothetical protein BRW62_09840 [Thermostichus lividus PCC 6715]MCI3281746.1 hypothetical protein [Synechococcus sp. PCC 6717]